MSQFHYVKCLGDNTWLSKPANKRVFKKDIREAAPLKVTEAKALGYGTAIYPIIPVEDVYPHKSKPFGGVAFDPQRRANDGEKDEPTNGERADAGKIALALACYDPSEVICAPSNNVTTGLLALGVNLTEAPEDALAELLNNLMHYCHREGIEFYGEDGVLPAAQRHFGAESGGAAL